MHAMAGRGRGGISRRAGDRRIEDIGAAIAVGREFKGRVEIVESQIGGVRAVADCQHASRGIVAVREMPRVCLLYTSNPR